MQTFNVIKVLNVVSLISLTTPCLLSAQTTYKITYTAEFSQFDLGFSKVAGYDLITMKGATVISELGKPVMPAKSVAIAIPARAVAVEFRSLGASKIPGNFYVMPGQPPILIGEKDFQLTEKSDDKIYSSNNPYPGGLATLDHQSNLAGQQIVWVTIYPVQYIPVEKQLILHNRVEVVVHCKREDENSSQELYHTFTDNQRKLYEDMIKRIVVNPHYVFINPPSCFHSFALPPGEFDHVIITSSSLASHFQPLVYWHMKRGIRDTVVTTDWIYATYVGSGDTTKIRQFVIDANTNWGTMYFLMGGENNVIPFAWREYHSTDIVPSDQYYSDFDDDWSHEVFVGRVSVDDTIQVNTFVNKVLKYEKNPPLTDYSLEILLIGMELFFGAIPGEVLKEEIAGYIPWFFNIHKIYDSHDGNHRDSVLYYLNTGQNLVNHCDHANYTAMGVGSVYHDLIMDISDVDDLTNTDKTSTIISVGCYANGMDYEDCIAEHFVVYNDSQAGVAFIGNTSVGLAAIGDPMALSCELDYWWWHGVFTQNQDNLGKALVYSKHQFVTDFDFERHCEWTFSLLGEPIMPIWTETPHIMQVNHASTIIPAPADFTVVVKDDDGVTPLENALVCCWIPNQSPEMYVREFTNASGEATLSISPATPDDTMYITGTKHNYLPYEGYALVGVGITEHRPEDPFVPIFTIYPTVFGKSLTIEYNRGQSVTSPTGQMEGSDEIELKIYDVSGRLVRQFNRSINQQFNQITWDGNDDSGRRVPAGVYFVHCIADPAGDAEEYIKFQKVIKIR
jgi:hypothetical protein